MHDNRSVLLGNSCSPLRPRYDKGTIVRSYIVAFILLFLPFILYLHHTQSSHYGMLADLAGNGNSSAALILPMIHKRAGVSVVGGRKE